LKTFRIDHILSPTREMKQIDGRRVLSPTACISLDDNMTQIVSRTLKAEAVGVSVRIFIFFYKAVYFSLRLDSCVDRLFIVTLDIHYITFSHHPPRHHNTTISAVLQHITNSYMCCTHRPPHRRQLHHTFTV